jgi:hypothetical protein
MDWPVSYTAYVHLKNDMERRVIMSYIYKISLTNWETRFDIKKQAMFILIQPEILLTLFLVIFHHPPHMARPPLGGQGLRFVKASRSR